MHHMIISYLTLIAEEVSLQEQIFSWLSFHGDLRSISANSGILLPVGAPHWTPLQCNLTTDDTSTINYSMYAFIGAIFILKEMKISFCVQQQRRYSFCTSLVFIFHLGLDRVVSPEQNTAICGKRVELGIQFQLRGVILHVSLLKKTFSFNQVQS